MRVKLSGAKSVIFTAVFVAAALFRPAAADEVLFNNGDRLSGTVLSVEAGKMKFKTAVAGEVTVDLKDVKTFTTDKPLEIRTKTNEIINAPAEKSDTPNAVRLPAMPTTQPSETATTGPSTTDLPLDQVKFINFDQKWSGAVVAGALFARGNTYADQANLSVDATRRTMDDRITLNGAYNFGRQRDPSTGEKFTSVDNWFAAGKYDYFFTEKFYGFASLRYEHDRIASLDQRIIPAIGVGYLWFDRPDFKFDTEAGLAFVHEKFDDGDTNDAMSLRLAYHLKKNLWQDKVALFHDLEYYPSLERIDDFLVVTDAGIRTAITDKMFAEYKIEYRYDSTPAQGFDHTDLRHIFGVGWKF